MRAHKVLKRCRIHDHMDARKPDWIYAGLARALGLESEQETMPQSHHFTLPETTVGELAARFQKKLGDKALRVVGDPKAKVSRLQLGVGYATPAINDPGVDVVVSGELQETDGALDSPAHAGRHDAGDSEGMDGVGPQCQRRAGMLSMATWIKGFVYNGGFLVQLVRSGGAAPGRRSKGGQGLCRFNLYADAAAKGSSDVHEFVEKIGRAGYAAGH